MSENKITLTKKIAGTAAFAALAFVISLLEFSIFPAAPFLKLDFSCVFILLAGFTFGPVSGLCASAVKELIRFLIGSSTGGVGEIANFIVTAAFIVVPTVVYRFKKGLPLPPEMGVVKWENCWNGENPNQQPSQPLTKLEGSETND